MPHVTLHLHGYPMLCIDGQPVSLKLKHGLALLAYLSQQRGPVGREHLAVLLWPNGGRDVARARLRRLVHELHRAVGFALLEGDVDRLWLTPGLATDLLITNAAIACASDRSRRLDAGSLAPLLQPLVAQWLAGFSLASESFSDWLDSQRRERQAAVIEALTLAARRVAAQGDAALSEAIAVALLRLDACAEPGHVARIEARALRGDAAGIETAYFECAQVLRGELGVRPSLAVENAYVRALAATRAASPSVAHARACPACAYRPW
ncbi:MAG: hypothetical protein V4792_05520 [Pseudomonadota bacterium]